MSGKRELPAWRRYIRIWGADPVRDIDDELNFHIDMRVRDLVQTGLSERAARERAAAEFGNVTNVREQMTEISARRARNERRARMLDNLLGDLRYAARHFGRVPLTTITIIVVLSLGIGTNVLLFTVLNSLATMPAPGIARDESLVRIRGTMHMKGMSGEHARLLSWPEVQEYSACTDLFNGVAAYAEASAVVNPGEGTSATMAADLIYTTPNYFRILNVHPAIGREPAAQPDVTRLTTPPGAMISYAMWQVRFGGAPDVIGRSIRINDIPIEIVGVAPARFIGAGDTGAMSVWVPLTAYPLLEKRTAAAFASYDSMFLSAAARLQPNVTTRTATSIVAGLAQRAFRPGQSGVSTQARGGDITLAQSESGSADVVPMLALNYRVSDRANRFKTGAAFGAFALLVLLITCTNVSALMVGLAVARRKEIGVRLSLGAPRSRLIRQLLTESILLALIAGAACLLITTVGLRLLSAMLVDIQLVIDWRVTLATCVVALLTGILFGLSPALHATRVAVGDVLKSSATAVAATRSRLQRVLVVAQITLTQPLLVGLGVVIVALITDLGRHTTSDVRDRIAEIELDIWAGNASAAERASRIAAVVERAAQTPGVTHALPMEMGATTMLLSVHPEDRIDGINYEPVLRMRMVAAPRGYFPAFEIPIVRGRDFDASEYALPAVANSAQSLQDMQRAVLSLDAMIIGNDLAQRLWGNANPLGRRLLLAGPTGAAPATARATLVVVGIVDEAVAGSSEAAEKGFRAFVPYSTMNTGVIARTAGPAAPMLDALRKTVAAEAPHMPISRAETMAQREAAFRRNVLRMSSAVAGGGLLALVLSAVGLYAVVSFAVGQRTREIGIRTALGQQHGEIVRMFFLRGLALSGFGLILGLPLSMIVTRLIVSKIDWSLTSSPLLGIAIGAVVLAVASLAVWIPARRASRIDPLAALRTE